MARKNTKVTENVVETLPAVGSPEFLQNLLDEANELQALDDAIDVSPVDDHNPELEQLLQELDAAEARSEAYQAQESETTIGDPSGQDQAGLPEDATFEEIVAEIPEHERKEYGGMIAQAFDSRLAFEVQKNPDNDTIGGKLGKVQNKLVLPSAAARC